VFSTTEESAFLDALGPRESTIERDAQGPTGDLEKSLSKGLQTRDMLEKIEQYASGSANAGNAARIRREMSWGEWTSDMKALAESRRD